MKVVRYGTNNNQNNELSNLHRHLHYSRHSTLLGGKKMSVFAVRTSGNGPTGRGRITDTESRCCMKLAYARQSKFQEVRWYLEYFLQISHLNN